MLNSISFILLLCLPAVAMAQTNDVKGDVITEEEIKDEMEYGARIRWTLLGGCLGYGVGGVPGYLYGAHRDRKGAIRRISSYKLLQELKSRNASEAEMQRAIDEAIAANMGAGYRWGLTCVGGGVGILAGCAAAAAIATEEENLAGISFLVASLIGASGGYYLGRDLDRRSAIRKVDVKLLQLGIQRRGAFLDEPLQKNLVTQYPNHLETDYILRLVMVRF